MSPTAATTGEVVPSEVTSLDGVERLHQAKLFLSRTRDPTVLVRLQRTSGTLTIRSDDQLVFSIGAQRPSQIIVPEGSEWHITAEQFQKGVSRYWVEAERFVGDDPHRASQARARWVSRGHATRVEENGALLSLQNQKLDSRTFTVAVEPQATKSRAKSRAKRFAYSRSGPPRIVEQVVRRSRAAIVARHPATEEEFRAPQLLTVRPRDEASTIEVVNASWPREQNATRSFRGALHFLVSQNGELLLINEVALESYLEGVVPAEMFTRSPLEALKAQAVLARGFALANFGNRHPGEPYHLCASAHCQAYKGTGPGTSHTDQAVQSTRGQVMMYSNVLVDSVYHSSCGGHTETYDRLWGGSPTRVMIGRSDGTEGVSPLSRETAADYILNPPGGAWCARSGVHDRVFRWQVRRSGKRISGILAARSNLSMVSGIEVTQRGHSGRALQVRYSGPEGDHLVTGASLNRRLLGDLLSGLWTPERVGGLPDGEPDHWIFHGGGHGHGVGLCQHGAIGMAKAGRDYKQILKSYYQRIRLEQLW